MTRSEEFIAQVVVRWHPGCGGGSAWIQWGSQAIDDFRSAKPGPETDAVSELANQLWADPENAGCRPLALRSPAGDSLFQCAVHYISNRRNWELATSKSMQAKFNALPREATGWARSVANLVEALFELPPDVLEMVRQAAAARNLRVPPTICLDDKDDLVDAVEVKLRLEHLINTGAWPTIPANSLDLQQWQMIVETALRVAGQPDCRAGKDIARRAIQHCSQPRACDGHELELAAIHILHAPDEASPLRERTRQRMTRIVQEYLDGPDPDEWREPRPDEDPDAWAERVFCATESEPQSVRDARNHPPAAARILARMGDEKTVAKIFRWLHNYPERAAALFEEYEFEKNCYEIVPPGKRRSLFLGWTVKLQSATVPPSKARRETVEVFRPIPGQCNACGSRLISLFDIAIDEKRYPGLPTARRLSLPMCQDCCDKGVVYVSRLLIDDPEDSDAWTITELMPNSLPLRQFTIADEQNPAAADVWLGGQPCWEQEVAWPKCNQCDRRMIFIGQAYACAGRPYLGFFCPACLSSTVLTQYD